MRGEPPVVETGTSAPHGLELFLLKLRYKEGRLITVEGNSPLLLDDPDSAWVVYAGKVDVFAVELQEGQPVGVRHHLLRAEPGTVLFGLTDGPASEGAPIRLLARGLPGSRVLRMKQARLRELAADLEHGAIVTALVENWITGLSQGVARGIIPKDAVLLERDQAAMVKAQAPALSRRGVLWVRHRAGRSRFLGRAGLAPVDGAAFFPLCRHTWLLADEEAELAGVDTPTFFARDPDWAGLAAFHRLALATILQNQQEDAQAEESWLHARAATAVAEVDTAFAQIAALLEPGADGLARDVETAAGDPLLAACRLVGGALVIEILPPPEARPDQSMEATLRAVAKAATVRVRQVGLRGAWWRKDCGPLLAFMADDGRPVALLLTTRGRYLLHDPAAPAPVPLTPRAAARLAPHAYTFYRPLPQRPLKIGELLEFGLRDCRTDLAILVLMGMALGLLGLVTPLAIGYIFDSLIPAADRGQLLQVGLALVVIAGASALFQLSRSIAVLRLEGRLDATLQAAVWDRLLALPVPFFREYSAGDLGMRAMGINTIRQTLSGPVITSILSGIFSLFNLGLLFYFDVRLGVVATGLVLVSTVITTGTGVFQVRRQRALSDIEGQLAGTMLQLITGIAKFRVAGAEGRAFALWARDFRRQKHLAVQAGRVANVLSVFNGSYPILTSIVLFAMVSASLQAGLSIGGFLAFNAAFSQLLLAGLDLSAALISILSIVPDYEGAKPILQSLPEVSRAKTDPGELAGEIEVSHLTFRYRADGPAALQDCSLHIRPGEFVALVGPSGSGKSTLFRLLLGFETPQAGAIYYDGQDLARLDPREVRQQIGVVLQDGKLMAGDLLQNIIGSSPATLDDAWDAVRQAGLEEDIRQMPQGLRTIIGEGGSTLSGGQRQRLLIARAIVKQPRLVFFDEATSALDNRTQDIIGKSLEGLQATRVVIAHRLSTIMNADRIFVFEGGRVAQSGTYGELLDQPGLFATLARRQMG